jgi:hypothetical protein
MRRSSNSSIQSPEKHEVKAVPRSRFSAIKFALLAIGLGAALSSCGGSTPTASFSSCAVGNGLPSAPSPLISSAALAIGATAPDTAASTTVPDVDSQPIQEAMRNLQNAGLTVGIQEPQSNLYVPCMFVITTDPAAGSKERNHFVVNLLISAGPPYCPNCMLGDFPMPNVIGLTLHQAKTKLAAQGLSLETYLFRASRQPRDEVIRSAPAANSLVTDWDGVTLVISSGPASSSSLCSAVSPWQHIFLRSG